MPFRIVPSRRDRRRRTPRIEKVEFNGTFELRVTFRGPMDTLQDRATFRLLDPSVGVVDFTGFSWDNDRTLVSNTSNVVAPWSGETFAVYLEGNIRALARFFLRFGQRSDSVVPF